MKYLFLLVMFLSVSFEVASEETARDTASEDPESLDNLINNHLRTKQRTKDSFLFVPHLSCDDNNKETSEIINCVHKNQHIWIRTI